MRFARPAAALLVILSCTPDHGVGPARPPALQADVMVAADLPAVRISEIHYDNSGTDVDEKIEVSGPAGTDGTSLPGSPSSGAS